MVSCHFEASTLSPWIWGRLSVYCGIKLHLLEYNVTFHLSIWTYVFLNIVADLWLVSDLVVLIVAVFINCFTMCQTSLACVQNFINFFMLPNFIYVHHIARRHNKVCLDSRQIYHVAKICQVNDIARHTIAFLPLCKPLILYVPIS